MTIKLLLLKSGEDIISDIQEMVVGEDEERRVVGYLLSKPCIIKIRDSQVLTEETEVTQKSAFQVSLYPWMPLSADTTIPVPADWVVTIVEPKDKLKEIIDLFETNEDTIDINAVDENGKSALMYAFTFSYYKAYNGIRAACWSCDNNIYSDYTYNYKDNHNYCSCKYLPVNIHSGHHNGIIEYLIQNGAMLNEDHTEYETFKSIQKKFTTKPAKH